MSSATIQPAAWPARKGAIRVLFFGKLSDALGRSLDLPAPGAKIQLWRVRELLRDAQGAAAAALEAPGIRSAVNQQLAGEDAWVEAGDEVAFFSMYSGG